MVVTDIDNTICNVNALLYGAFDIPEEIYPAPTPPGFWEDTGLVIFAKAKPFAIGVELLKSVSGGSFDSLAYLTCRPRVAEFLTRRWLNLHGFPEAPVFFCRDAEEKVAVATSLNATAAMEDDPETARMYARAGIVVFLPDWPYNRLLKFPSKVVKVKGVVRCGYSGA